MTGDPIRRVLEAAQLAGQPVSFYPPSNKYPSGWQLCFGPDAAGSLVTVNDDLDEACESMIRNIISNYQAP